jgi:hypothetical protein
VHGRGSVPFKPVAGDSSCFGGHMVQLSMRGSSTTRKPTLASSGSYRPVGRPCFAANRCRRSVRTVHCSSSSNSADDGSYSEPCSSASSNGRKPYPKDEWECSKCLNQRRVDEHLKPICGWDVEGLPKHHTSRCEQMFCLQALLSNTLAQYSTDVC